MTDEAERFDARIAHSARVNNYWHGGKDNFAADRTAAGQALDVCPDLPAVMKAARAFRRRTVRHLTGPAGLRQFLDVGAGLPTGDAVHQIAQAIEPECRVVYIDHDPMVISHGRALMAGNSPGRCLWADADARDVDQVMAAAARILDLARPTAVILSAILHLIPDDEHPQEIVRGLMAAVAPGSHLVLVHPSSDLQPAASEKMQNRLNDLVAQKRQYRDRAAVTGFFDGLELLDPGVVPVPRWRPDTEAEAAAPTLAWCGVARKPDSGGPLG